MNVGRYLRGEDLHVGTSRITKPKELKMNERIKELIVQATEVSEPLSGNCSPDAPDLDKLVELIVRECAAYMYEHYPHSRYEINYMRKHMGDKDWNKPIGGVEL
jgi:hypothetical protein